MKKYKFKAPNRTFQLLLPFLFAADNFAIVFLLCRLGLGILGRIGLADFLLQDPVLDYITKAVLILSVVYSLFAAGHAQGLLFVRRPSGACPLYHYRFELEEQDRCTVLYDRERLCEVQQYLLDEGYVF